MRFYFTARLISHFRYWVISGRSGRFGSVCQLTKSTWNRIPSSHNFCTSCPQNHAIIFMPKLGIFYDHLPSHSAVLTLYLDCPCMPWPLALTAHLSSSFWPSYVKSAITRRRRCWPPMELSSVFAFWQCFGFEQRASQWVYGDVKTKDGIWQREPSMYTSNSNGFLVVSQISNRQLSVFCSGRVLDYRLVQKKGTVLLSTSLAWPAVPGCSLQLGRNFLST